MSNYTKTTDFAAKDTLLSGNPSKIVKGTEIDTEFNAIATAIATKAELTLGAFQLASGSLSAPSYSFASSTSTGIFSPAVNQLGFVTAGTQAAYFDASQNLTLTHALAVAQGGTGATTASAARTNLGVSATGADTNYAFRSNNLSDLQSLGAARNNLGLTTAAITAMDQAAAGSTIVQRTSSGNINASYLNQTSGQNENPTLGQIFVESSAADGFLRKAGLNFVARSANLTMTIQPDPGTTPTLSAGQIAFYY